MLSAKNYEHEAQLVKGSDSFDYVLLLSQFHSSYFMMRLKWVNDGDVSLESWVFLASRDE